MNNTRIELYTKILGILCLTFFVAFTYFVHLNQRDDIVFSSFEINISYLVERYNTWSSRLLIEFFVIFFNKNLIIFKFFNTLVLVSLPLIIWKIIKICSISSSQNSSFIYCIYIIVFLYNFGAMKTAGWVTTTVFYFYPLYALLLAFLIKRSFFGLLFKSVYILLLLFACNNELSAIIVFLISIFYLVLQKIKNKPVDSYVYISLVISILMISFSAICPGNHHRSVIEISTWFPEFANFGLTYKIYLGIFDTLHHYSMTRNVSILFLIATLLILNKVKSKYAILVIILLYGLMHLFKFIESHYFVFYITKDFSIYSIFSLIYTVIFWLLIIGMLFKTIKFSNNLIIVLSIIAACLISRFVMGLSPTIFASGERTFIFLDFSILITSALLLHYKNVPLKNYYMVLFVCFLFQAFSNVKLLLN